MTNLDLAREWLKENPDMTVGDAVFIKSFAMWLDGRSQKPCCPDCGLTDIEFNRICHNSKCPSYARGITTYEGWRTPEPSEVRSREDEAFRLLNAATYYVPKDRELIKEMLAWMNCTEPAPREASSTLEEFFRCKFCQAEAPKWRHVCGDEFTQHAAKSSEGQKYYRLVCDMDTVEQQQAVADFVSGLRRDAYNALKKSGGCDYIGAPQGKPEPCIRAAGHSGPHKHAQRTTE